jgi:hypothetical protein
MPPPPQVRTQFNSPLSGISDGVDDGEDDADGGNGSSGGEKDSAALSMLLLIRSAGWKKKA